MRWEARQACAFKNVPIIACYAATAALRRSKRRKSTAFASLWVCKGEECLGIETRERRGNARAAAQTFLFP
jgi:hypothetical protein